MMVVHEDNERPPEIAVIRKPLLEQKSYVIVKNHVRELDNTAQKTSKVKSYEDKSPPSSGSEDEKKKRKSVKKLKKTEEIPTTSSGSEFITNSATEIDSNDLEELKTVYLKCKEVMKRIETKYGHLLDLEDEAGSSSQPKKRKLRSEQSESECECKIKKKIIFDEEGRQSTVETIPEKHICVKKMKDVPIEPQTRRKSIAVEYEDTEIVLPDNLSELWKLLHDPNIENTYRNLVLNKINTLKQEYTNEIRFNKHILIEKLKTNPDELLDFKGTNLSSIPGYS